jgi:hypothetical protein
VDDRRQEEPYLEVLSHGLEEELDDPQQEELELDDPQEDELEDDGVKQTLHFSQHELEDLDLEPHPLHFFLFPEDL